MLNANAVAIQSEAHATQTGAPKPRRLGRPPGRHPSKVCSKCKTTKEHRKRNQDGGIVYLDGNMRRWHGDLCWGCYLSPRGKRAVGQSLIRASFPGEKIRQCRTCGSSMINRYFNCTSCIPVLEDYGDNF